MPRRRLRLRCSSDEDNEDDEAETRGNGNVLLNHSLSDAGPRDISPASTSNGSRNPSSGERITISDDELIDVSDDPTPPPQSTIPPTPCPVTPPDSDIGDDSPIAGFLSRMGLRLKRDWLVACLTELERSVPRFNSLDVAAKAKLCFEQFLFSDMNHSGGGVLPRDIRSMHLVELGGPFVLQVDEIVNIGCPLKGRYENANAGLKRCLKLSMTDGVQRVFGMEYRPIKDLQVLDPAGLKIVISSVQVRHGLLMLVPEVLDVLGGVVEELEEARKRLVVEVNKPPRGKRTRTGGVPSLAARATQAAWSLNGNDNDSRVYSSTSRNTNQFRADGQGDPLNETRTDIGLRQTGEPPASNSMEATVSGVEDMQIDRVSVSGERTVFYLPSTSGNMHTAPSTIGTGCSSVRAAFNNNGENNLDHQTSRVTAFVEEMHMDNVHVSGPGSGTTEHAEFISMVDDDSENPFILSRNAETPFTYLANMSARWAAMKDTVPSVRGKIKCFLTGVKNFRYKQRLEYELLCYVDDGSLIYEIMIHHKVVEKGIGHSPMEVSAALSSSNPTMASSMKEKLRQFQMFLANFEGKMVIEMNKTSEYPIAMEVEEGCSSSDAWLLFQRLKPPDAIVLSP
ncbi:PREDICTED: recQ-mediated genome instability protein 1 [Tarenaya hassleriana]|uniref:recQ-mediated genome instability protein 1 n=1 Tax=Tarenaya hassleriana TaxID=28532 RepID=UPI00053C5BC6|nr:PREDICTED: recQ-mediated genome instability protein 1 [Tarenaya hassleriana]